MILVTGGSGFVGPHVVHALRAADLQVRCLVRDPTRSGALERWGCEVVRGDVTDAASVRRAVEGCDTVVHLVAILAGTPEDFERVMIGGGRNVVEAARAEGVGRFVLMSALGTGEETKDLVPYYHAKWRVEQAVQESGIDHTIFRPSFIFGSDGGILPTLLRLVRWSPVTPIMGDGRQRSQPIWVEDVAAFFARSLELEEARNRTFELGGPEAVTWNQLYERIRHVLGKRRATVHLPIALMRKQAALLERLPRPPLTRDQLTMLQGPDNVCDMRPALATFELPLVGLSEQIRRAA